MHASDRALVPPSSDVPVAHATTTPLVRRTQIVAAPAFPPTASRPSRRLWLRAPLFCASVLLGALALHIAITAGLRRITTSNFGATNRLVNGTINAELIVTGSSRALVHYDPRILASATGLTTYNLGRNGSQTDLQVALLKTYLQHNAPPRLLIHNLDLYAFVTSREIYDPVQYLPYLNEPALYAAVRRTYPDAWKWKYVPLYGYVVPDARFTWMLGLRRLAGFEPAEDHRDGFVPRDREWTDDFEQFRRAHPDGVRTAVEAQGIRDLEEIITIAHDHRIPLLLVYSPEFAAIQPLETNRRAIFDRFRALAVRHGVPFWDFSAEPLSAQRAAFYNSQHLNRAGASAFSFELGERLKAAGFAPPPLHSASSPQL